MLTYSFKNMSKEDKMPDNFKGTDMEKIYDKARIAAMSPEEYDAYWSEIFAEEKRLDEKATAYNEGKADGRAEGKAEDAIKMLELGIGADIISKVTGLSNEFILSLNNKETEE